eukprot:6382073-Prymnesium_polylepis.1
MEHGQGGVETSGIVKSMSLFHHMACPAQAHVGSVSSRECRRYHLERRRRTPCTSACWVRVVARVS